MAPSVNTKSKPSVNTKSKRIAIVGGGFLTIALLALIIARGLSSTDALPSPAFPVYSFAGIRAAVDPATVEGIRAVITWSVEPSTSSQSSQSTWIGLYAEPKPQQHVSFEIVQIGWKQVGSGEPRLFWEWSVGRDDFHVSYGSVVHSAETLDVEIDRLGTNGYKFISAGTEVGRASVPWKPTLAAANGETHHPADLMAGSAQSPEMVRDVAVKVTNEWHHLGGRTFSTNSNYLASLGQPGEIEIWDVRN